MIRKCVKVFLVFNLNIDSFIFDVLNENLVGFFIDIAFSQYFVNFWLNLLQWFKIFIFITNKFRLTDKFCKNYLKISSFWNLIVNKSSSIELNFKKLILNRVSTKNPQFLSIEKNGNFWWNIYFASKKYFHFTFHILFKMANSIKLQPDAVLQIPFYNYENDFTFVVNSERFNTYKFIPTISVKSRRWIFFSMKWNN